MQLLINNTVLWSHVGIWKLVVEVMKPEFELVCSDSIALFIEVEIRLAVNHSGLLPWRFGHRGVSNGHDPNHPLAENRLLMPLVLIKSTGNFGS